VERERRVSGVEIRFDGEERRAWLRFSETGRERVVVVEE
jgi:hypothetical protein